MSKETTKGGAPGKDPGKAKPKRKLTREEKKQIAAIIRQAKGDGKAHTAQQTIPYINLYPDGICRVTERKYSKSIVFEDINYQLAQADDKTAIFENWCDFLNYFDASVSVQLSFINQGARKEKAQAAIEIPAQDDACTADQLVDTAICLNSLFYYMKRLLRFCQISLNIDGFLILDLHGRLNTAAYYIRALC